MRTTVQLPDDLHRRAKQHAAGSGMTFTELLTAGLRLVLREEQFAREEPGRYVVDPLPAGRGLQPGVDLSDTADLLDRMEGR